MKTVTPEEKSGFFLFWSAQRRAIEDRVSEKTMRWVNIYTNKDNVGYEFGQLRPGKDGQWDLYHALTGEQSLGCNQNETLIASGLTAAEVAEEGRREYYRQRGVDPDKPLEVMATDRLARMNPAELDTEILRLEREVAKFEEVPA